MCHTYIHPENLIKQHQAYLQIDKNLQLNKNYEQQHSLPVFKINNCNWYMQYCSIWELVMLDKMQTRVQYNITLDVDASKGIDAVTLQLSSDLLIQLLPYILNLRKLIAFDSVLKACIRCWQKSISGIESVKPKGLLIYAYFITYLQPYCM